MARKRKIPAKKHFGVIDPEKQRIERMNKIKNKINNPPEKDDSQKIPKKLAELMKIRNEVKRGKIFKVKRFIDNEDKPKNYSKSKIRPIRKLQYETDEDYLKRVNRATTQSMKESEYEIKYGVEVQRDPKTGEIKIKKKPKDEFAEMERKDKKSKFKKNLKPMIVSKESKELIKQVLKEEKFNKGKEKYEEFKKDPIKFGETVHRPPVLVTPRKAQKNETVPRPGQKNNLLLRNMLNGNDNTEASSIEQKPKKQTHKYNNLKGKRKDLLLPQRKMIEDEQKRVIELYRKIKKDKNKLKT